MNRKRKRLLRIIPSVLVIVVLGSIGLAAAWKSYSVHSFTPNLNQVPEAYSTDPEVAGVNLGLFDGSRRKAFEKDFDETLVTTRFFRMQWHRMAYLLFSQTLPGVHIGESGFLFTTEEWYENKRDFSFRPTILEGNPMADDSLAASGAAIPAVLSASNSLENLGIQLVVVLVPAKNRILEEYTKLPLSNRLSTRYQSTLAQLSAAGILAVDLETVFLQYPAREDLYMRTDTHWSPEGARTAATAIADFLSEQGLQEFPIEVEFKTEAGVAELFRGDLMEFLPVPSNSDPASPHVRFGFLSRDLPEPETLSRYSTVPIGNVTQEMGLFDTPIIPVALTGTSYSSGEEWNFAGFMMESLRTDLVNLSHSGIGPFEPMAALIQDPLLQELGVELVFWEIPERYLVP